jgi:dihydroorotase
MLSQVVNFTAKQFKRAIIMPNLTPPVITVKRGMEYRERIFKSVDPSLSFTPLMVSYLTDDIDKDEVKLGYNEGVFTAAKLYPANATTNSSMGVTDVKNIYPYFRGDAKNRDAITITRRSDTKTCRYI